MRIFSLIIMLCWSLVIIKFSNTLMVLLVCMAFVGQTMASTMMPYQMMSMMGMNGQAQPQNMSMIDHSNHNMASDMSSYANTDDKSEDSMVDCCTKTCNCFTGACSSIAILMMGSGNVPFVDLSSKILSYSHLALSHQPTSLYRPPILS